MDEVTGRPEDARSTAGGPPGVSFPRVVPLIAGGALLLVSCAELVGLPDLSYRGEGRRLTSVQKGGHQPVVSGDRVVWRDSEAGSLKLCDLEADTVRTLVRSAAPILGHDVQDGRLVWSAALDTSTRAGGGPTRLELMNLRDGTRRTLGDDSVRTVRPSLWGNRLVREDHRHGNAEIYLSNLELGSMTRITEAPDPDHDPVVWRDVVAWVRGQGGRVHLLDLQSGEHDVISGSVATGRPDLRDGHLVWEDRRGPSYDVYHYDVGTGQQERLGSSLDVDQFGSDQRAPSVSGTAVVRRGHPPGTGRPLPVRSHDRYRAADRHGARQLPGGARHLGRHRRLGRGRSNRRLRPVWPRAPLTIEELRRTGVEGAPAAAIF